MKKLTSLLLVSILSVLLPACAAPLPPIRGSTIVLGWDAPAQPGVVAATRIYRGMPDDSSWSFVSLDWTTAQITITNASYGEIFFGVFVDANGVESDRSNAFTNTLTFSGPQHLNGHR